MADRLRVHVRGIMGIADWSADLDTGVATEVCGANAVGKSSLATALAAVASRTANPAALSAATVRAAYVHDGTADASCTVEWGDRREVWRPAAGEIVAGQSAPLSSMAAVGLVDWTSSRSETARLSALHQVVLPPSAEVEQAVLDALIELLGEQDATGAIELVRERGWKEAATVYADRARQAKREWNAITHRTYGVKVAADWRPDGWTADLDTLAVLDAEAAVVGARDAVAALQSAHAISAEDHRRAVEARDHIPEAQTAVEQAQYARAAITEPDVAAVQEKLATLRNRRDAIRRLDHEPKTCPACSAPLVVDVMGGIVAAHPPTQEQLSDLAAAQTEMAELEEQVAQRLAEHRGRVEAADRVVQDAVARRNQLQSTAADAGAQVRTDETLRQVSVAEQELDEAKAYVSMVTRARDAATAHATAQRYTAAATALGPRGPRGKLMKAGLTRLRAGLAVLSNTAEWPSIEVTDQGEVQVHGRPALLCSESERWRAQAAMQLTAAALDASRLVVLDRADVLDVAGRRGLMAALDRVCARTGITVVVCAMGDPAGERSIRMASS